MGETKIEWAERVWQPMTGCTKISPGCRGCYASRMSKRLAGRYGYPADEPFRVTLHGDRLNEPLTWRKPAMVFVCSMGDLFHKDVPDGYISEVFTTMSVAPGRHTFLVLTKRPERMREVLERIAPRHTARNGTGWPLENLWLGTSVENSDYLHRIDDLRQCLAAKRFVSFEPLLGSVQDADLTGIDWAIAGGETGPKARPMHPAWVREIRDKCQQTGTAFFFKAWGEWVPWGTECGGPSPFSPKKPNYSPEQLAERPSSEYANGKPYQFVMGPGGAKGMVLVGKKTAGRLLDGKVWDEIPQVPRETT